jgi:hypothetical protein
VSTVTSFIFFGLASGNTTLARDRLAHEIELRKTYEINITRFVLTCYARMEKLMLEKEAAELADRTKSAFVATVSHEVKLIVAIHKLPNILTTDTYANEHYYWCY